MPFPFVSRALHEAVCEALRARAERAESEITRANQRADEATKLLLERVSPKVVQEPANEDPVQAAIRLRAGTNGIVRRAMGQFVREARALDMQDDELLNRLMSWRSSDDEGIDG